MLVYGTTHLHDQVVGIDLMALICLQDVVEDSTLVYDFTLLTPPDHVQVVCHARVLPVKPLICEHCEPVPDDEPHSLVEMVKVPVEMLVY